METTMISRWSRHVCWLAAVAAILWPALDAVAQGKVRSNRQTTAQADDAPDQAQPARAADTGPASWWLGVECVPVEQHLAKHLRLKPGQGLLVMHVVDGSAADEAGLKVDDVLLRAGDRELRTVGDLVDAVRASGGEKLSIELVREGEKQSIEITPKKRTRDPFFDPAVLWGRTQPFRFRVLGPGVIEPFDMKIVRERPKLPEDVTVTITARGEEPLRVQVQRGDETWDLAQDELDQLPKDLRPAVQALLPGQVFHRAGQFTVPMPEGPYPGFRFPGPNLEELKIPGNQELQQQIDELRKRLEEMQKQLPN